MDILDDVGKVFTDLGNTIGRESNNFIHTIDREVITPVANAGLVVTTGIGALIGGVGTAISPVVQEGAGFVSNNILMPVRDLIVGVPNWIGGAVTNVVNAQEVRERLIYSLWDTLEDDFATETARRVLDPETMEMITIAVANELEASVADQVGQAVVPAVVEETGGVLAESATSATVGGFAGAPLAPATGGTSILIGAAIGGAVGLVVGGVSKFIAAMIRAGSVSSPEELRVALMDKIRGKLMSHTDKMRGKVEDYAVDSDLQQILINKIRRQEHMKVG